MVYNWRSITQTGRLRHLLFPPSCLLCDRPGEADRDLCRACHDDLPRPAPSCPCCAATLPPGAPAEGLCGRCQADPPAFDRTLALFDYAPPVDRMIWDLKYHRKLAVARLFAELFREHLTDTEPPDRLIPVPLHPKRLRERGFNQSLEIARLLGKAAGIPVDYQTCKRIRPTPPQSELSATERRRNLGGAFRTNSKLTGQRIAIIDDVMTTGSTVQAVARSLRAAGAAEVQAWVCARAG